MMTLRGAKNWMALLVIFAFLATGFALFSHGAMSMDGPMADCPFMPGAFICTMTPLDMIAASQYQYAALGQQTSAGFLLSLLLAALALVALWKRLVPLLAPLAAYATVRPMRTAPHDPLQELFSNGILNPKPY